jgi:hypothetical protein
LKITLDIDTGSGNYALVSTIGSYRFNYGILWQQAGLQPIGDLSNRSASDVVGEFDKVVQRMHDDTAQFAGLAEPILRDYDEALAFLTRWRNECRLHPNTRVSVPVEAMPAK